MYYIVLATFFKSIILRSKINQISLLWTENRFECVWIV
jgi:hypothetical protein